MATVKMKYKVEYMTRVKCDLYEWCNERGIEFKIIADYQFRVAGHIDIFPKSRKYFLIRVKRWGQYTNLFDFLRNELATF